MTAGYRDANFGQGQQHKFGEKFIMETKVLDLIKTAYAAFNSRNIDQALSTFHPEVQWPKAFEGGYVTGHEEIRKYWTRQWSEINPNVEPTGFIQRPNGLVEVSVHQLVRDLQGEVLFDGNIKHIFTIQDGLLQRMHIEME